MLGPESLSSVRLVTQWSHGGGRGEERYSKIRSGERGVNGVKEGL
jgi:hypothetical protein